MMQRATRSISASQMLLRSSFEALLCQRIVPGGVSSQTVREKHSKRQIKRLFDSHPAQRRKRAIMGIDQTPQPLDPPQFAPIYEPQFIPTGWSKPPPEGMDIPDYPFKVSRTADKPFGAAGYLPVYVRIRNDGGATTLIKKVTGDRDLFLKELRAVLNLPVPKNDNARFDSIRVRTGGNIEVKGHRVREVKEWLAGLGF